MALSGEMVAPTAAIGAITAPILCLVHIRIETLVGLAGSRWVTIDGTGRRLSRIGLAHIGETRIERTALFGCWQPETTRVEVNVLCDGPFHQCLGIVDDCVGAVDQKSYPFSEFRDGARLEQSKERATEVYRDVIAISIRWEAKGIQVTFVPADDTVENLNIFAGNIGHMQLDELTDERIARIIGDQENLLTYQEVCQRATLALFVDREELVVDFLTEVRITAVEE